MDRIGRRPVIIFSRVATASSCFVYAFATDWIQIVAVEAFIGIALAAWLSGQSTYILDLAPQRLRATYLAMSMTAVGVSTFIGSYTTGALAQTYLARLGLRRNRHRSTCRRSSPIRFRSSFLYLLRDETQELER